MNLDQLTQNLNPDIIERFKEAIAIGRWPDGRKLTEEQRKICIQAVIAYEHKHVKAEERTAYIPPKVGTCGGDEEKPVKWE